jgi:threonine dehydratase
MAGQGTTAIELLEDVPDLDMLLCPVGGGGQLSGVAVAARTLRPQISVIGVEPAGADDAQRSFRSGKLIPSVNPKSIADGLPHVDHHAGTAMVVVSLVEPRQVLSQQETPGHAKWSERRRAAFVVPNAAATIHARVTKASRSRLQREARSRSISESSVASQRSPTPSLRPPRLRRRAGRQPAMRDPSRRKFHSPVYRRAPEHRVSVERRRTD